ncbi:hypothetical protein OPT61_g4882 [Boeremia exigua]|uniref:Uncharacterized protein n=1 Tax=Boeremia exigua TaxID=749465 RepID=A0ACC2ICG7_9PLEO|nr:hypothetical protein OPT61_g4882 [Boeremia exigua]
MHEIRQQSDNRVSLNNTSYTCPCKEITYRRTAESYTSVVECAARYSLGQCQELTIVGTEDQLWPQHLTLNHTGPEYCGGEDKGQTGYFVCLHGGWDIIKGFVTPEGVSKRSVSMIDAGVQRTMWAWRPFATDTDTWVSTAHAPSAYLATHLKIDHDNAWGFAQGRQRRLRDATPLGMYVRLIGRIPVARVLCAPCRELQPGPFSLAFPVLEDGKHWRWQDTPGPIEELQLDPVPVSRISATWISLPPRFGDATAGLAFVFKNETSSLVGCGCAVDARWAQGQSTLFGDTVRWETVIGPPTIPQGNRAPEPARLSFSDSIEQSCGPTITADPEWLASLLATFPIPTTSLNVTSIATRTSFTTLEDITLKSRLWDVPWLLSDAVQPIQEMEAILGFYFVNALSRIGWDPQRNGSTGNLNSLLRKGSANNDQLLHDNAQPYPRPSEDIAPTSALRQEWFNYTTAWQLNESALCISVAILAMHLIIVVIHCIYVLWTAQSSEAWNSIPELIALAYNSRATGDTLENCGAGIMLMKTLGQEVKVVANSTTPLQTLTKL